MGDQSEAVVEQTTRNGKAVGTRDRVVTWLAAHGDLEESSGMASTVLARSIGYPGSSIAFAQLLSGMERSGLIAREVRGKRTYRVTLTEAGRNRARTGGEALRRASGRRERPDGRTAPTPRAAAGQRHGAAGETGVDYDELARRLLVQVARRLAAEDAREPGADQVEERRAGGAGPEATGDGTDQFDAFERRLRALEVELTRARATRVALEEENEELRGQLERIRGNLGGESRRSLRERVPPPPERVDRLDRALLQQMMSDREQAGRDARDEADSA